MSDDVTLGWMLGTVLRWLVLALLIVAFVGFLAKARGEPGDDGRSPDPEHTLVSSGGASSGLVTWG
jgi:hypothetical protein